MEKQRIINLSGLIEYHNHQYYVLGDPEITDTQYDHMFRKLVELEEQYPEYADPNSPTKRVGSDIKNKFAAIDHLTPMRSINAANSQAVTDFISSNNCCAQLKYDGAGVSLIYRDGNLYKAISRGDGNKGYDITDNIRTIRNIPLRINLPGTVEIRGEVWCPVSELKRLQSEGLTVKSPLSVAVNSLRLGKSATLATRKLQFTAYHISPLTGIESTHTSLCYLLYTLGFDAPKTIQVTHHTDLSVLRTQLTDSDIPSDGMVFKVDNLLVCEIMGHTPRYINWAIALKFDEAVAQTVITALSHNVTASGLIVSTAAVKPVTINYDTLSAINLTRSDISKQLYIGQTIIVRRAGTRIAIIESVLPPSNTTIPAFTLPHTCPVCSSRLRNSKERQFCDNPVCPVKTAAIPDLIPGYDLFKDFSIAKFSTSQTTIRSVSIALGLKPVTISKTHIRIFYNSTEQLAILGYALGLVVTTDMVKYRNIIENRLYYFNAIIPSKQNNRITFNPANFNANVQKVGAIINDKHRNLIPLGKNSITVIFESYDCIATLFFTLAVDQTTHPEPVVISPKYSLTNDLIVSSLLVALIAFAYYALF
jgi:hypothetical protein